MKNVLKAIELIEKTLTQNNIDYNKLIDGFGQVTATEKRENGYTFTLNEHIKALIMSQLSNQRAWG